MAIPSSNHHFFQADNQKAVLFTLFSLLELFSATKLLFRWRKKTYLELRPLFRLQIFSLFKCCDIQGSRLIGYLRVSLIIDQLECPGFYFFCAELTLFFCIERETITQKGHEIRENIRHQKSSELVDKFSIFTIVNV